MDKPTKVKGHAQTAGDLRSVQITAREGLKQGRECRGAVSRTLASQPPNHLPGDVGCHLGPPCVDQAVWFWTSESVSQMGRISIYKADENRAAVDKMGGCFGKAGGCSASQSSHRVPGSPGDLSRPTIPAPGRTGPGTSVTHVRMCFPPYCDPLAGVRQRPRCLPWHRLGRHPVLALASSLAITGATRASPKSDGSQH